MDPQKTQSSSKKNMWIQKEFTLNASTKKIPGCIRFIIKTSSTTYGIYADTNMVLDPLVVLDLVLISPDSDPMPRWLQPWQLDCSPTPDAGPGRALNKLVRHVKTRH